jgi:putative transposase
MSYVSSIYHIVFSTYRRQSTITESHKKDLYNYIWGILKAKGCPLIRINGISNHLHLLIELNQSISLAELICQVKHSSSVWLRDNEDFPKFRGWGKEYAAFSCSFSTKETIKSYIMNQERHHQVFNYDDEMKDMLESCGMKWFDDKK